MLGRDGPARVGGARGVCVFNTNRLNSSMMKREIISIAKLVISSKNTEIGIFFFFRVSFSSTGLIKYITIMPASAFSLQVKELTFNLT